MENTIKDSGIIFNIKRFSLHDGPGIRTSIFLKGCPLNCIWCHNPEGIKPDFTIWYNQNICIACGQCTQICPNGALILNSSGNKYVEINRNLCSLTGDCVRICPSGALEFTGKVVTINELMDEISKDMVFYLTSGGGVTLTGGEPTYQPEFCIGILKACKGKNITTSIETSLFCDRNILESLMDVVDLFIVDIKIFDPVVHEQYTGQPNHIIKENLVYLAETGKDIAVRVPLIKGITDSVFNIENIEKFVRDLKLSGPIEYLSFNQLTKSKYQRLCVPYLLD
jgi:pyruvate formate lyase activating enzyme